MCALWWHRHRKPLCVFNSVGTLLPTRVRKECIVGAHPPQNMEIRAWRLPEVSLNKAIVRSLIFHPRRLSIRIGRPFDGCALVAHLLTVSASRIPLVFSLRLHHFGAIRKETCAFLAPAEFFSIHLICIHNAHFIFSSYLFTVVFYSSDTVHWSISRPFRTRISPTQPFSVRYYSCFSRNAMHLLHLKFAAKMELDMALLVYCITRRNDRMLTSLSKCSERNRSTY